LDWLRNGATAAGLRLTDARLVELADPSKLSFELLRTVL
jgi:hypothetical protein